MKRLALFLSLVFLVGCGGNSDNLDNQEINKTPPSSAKTDKFVPNNGRLLAATNCFQCHGTDGYSKTKWDSIAGEDMDEFYEREHPIMSAQIDGFKQDEVNAMFNYLQNLKKATDTDNDDENDD